VLERKSYLISASLGPLPRRARALVDGYLRDWAEIGAPEPLWHERIFPRLRGVKELFAALIGADAGELALQSNVSAALSSVASCLDLSGDRRRIVVSDLDFPTEGQIWCAQERRGAEVVFVPSADGLTVPVEAYERVIDERTALVCMNRVLYRSGALLDAGAVCRLAREAGALSVVDDYHGAGVVPVDVHELGCDFYTAGVLKWLCGGPGLAFLYVRAALLPSLEPTVTGWWAQPEPFSFSLHEAGYHATARRFELGTHPAPVAFLAHAGLEIVSEVTPARIRARQAELTERAIALADEAGIAVRSPRPAELRGGSVNLRVGPDALSLAEALYRRDVCVDARGDGIRVAPHFFSDEAEIDHLFAELGRLRPGMAPAAGGALR
jgi:kynureninase